MAPNLAVLALTIVSPQRWFASRKRARTGSPPRDTLVIIEHWNSPVAGTYRHQPGMGWYLISRDDDPDQPETPDKVIWSDALDRKILKSEYMARSKQGKLPRVVKEQAVVSASSSLEKGKEAQVLRPSSASKRDETEAAEVNFVMLDDGITWVNDKDAKGAAIKGPWPRFCIDKKTGEFRPMLRSDAPKRSRQPSERTSSVSTTRGSLDNRSGGKPVSRSSSYKGRPESSLHSARPKSPRAGSRLSQQTTIPNEQTNS